MKIGFIDHHLNNYHANKFHTLLTGDVGKGEVEISAAWESDPTGDDWCAAKNVYRATSPSEVVAKSDAVIVLAPDNVDAHWTLAQAALDSKKPVFIDKVLASSMKDARAIVKMAATHSTPIMSSSSLRYSVELEELVARIGNAPIDSIFSRGIGKWRGYAVHTIAPVIRLLNARVKRVMESGDDNARIITLDDGKRRTLVEMRFSDNQMEATPWQVGVLVANKYDVITVQKYDEFYANLMTRALEFFRTGKSPITTEEMLEHVAIEDAVDESRAQGGKWVDVTL